MSKYQYMEEESPSNSPTYRPPKKFPNQIEDPISQSIQMRKCFKAFDNKKTSNKFQAFSKWVECPKSIPNKALYNQIKDLEFHQDLVFIVHQEAEVICLGLSMKTLTLAVGLANNKVNLINSKTGDPKFQIALKNETKLRCLAITEKFLYTGGDRKAIEIYTYSQENYSKVREFLGHEGCILCMTVTIIGNDEHLLCRDSCGQLIVWNVTENSNRKLDVGSAINAILVTPDSAKKIILCHDNKIKLFNFVELSLIIVLDKHKETVMTLAISPMGDKFASVSDKNVKSGIIWDLNKLEGSQELGFMNSSRCMTFFHNGNDLAAADREGNSLKLFFSTKIPELSYRTSIEGHNGKIMCLVSNPKSSLVFSGSLDKIVRGWNLNHFKNSHLLIGSKDEVLAMAVIPMTSYLISAGKEKIIRVWNLDKALMLEQFDSGMQEILSLAITNGGKVVAGGADGTITIWEIQLPNLIFKHLASCNGHSAGVCSIKFSKVGNFIISGSFDASIKIWDLTLNKQIRELKKYPGIISALELTPDDNIVTGNKSSELCLWDFKTLKNVRSFKGHTGEITAIKATGINKLVTASQDKTIKIWNLLTGVSLNSLELPENAIVLSLEISHDFKKIISGGKDECLRIWDISTGEQIGIDTNYNQAIKTMTIEQGTDRLISNGKHLKIINFDKIKTIKIIKERIDVMTLSPDYKLLAIGINNYIRIYDLSTCKPFPKLKDANNMNLLKFTPDNKRLISCGRENSAMIWDLQNLNEIKCIKTCNIFRRDVSGVDFLEFGKKAIFSCRDGTLYLYDMKTLECIVSANHYQMEIACIVVNADDRLVYTASISIIHIFAIEEKEISPKGELGKHESNINFLILTKKKDRLISASNTAIKIWNVKERALITILRNGARSLCLNSTGSKLISFHWPQNIQIWDLNKFKRLAVLKSSKHIDSIAIDEINDRLYTGDYNDNMREWNLKDSNQYLFIECHCEWVTNICLTPDNNFLISISRDQCLIIWNLKTGKQKVKFHHHSGAIHGLVITTDGSKAITCTENKEIGIWDLNSQCFIEKITVEWEVSFLALSRDDKHLILSCKDSIIRAYDIDSREFVKRFEDEGHLPETTIAMQTLDSTKLVSGRKDHMIIIWNYGNAKVIQKIIESHNGPITSLAFPKGKDYMLISGSIQDFSLRFWNIDTGTLIKKIATDMPVYGLIVNSDTKVFISTGTKICCYDLETYSELKSIKLLKNESVYSITLTLDGKSIFGGGELSGAISIWDVQESKFNKYLSNGFCKVIDCEIISPDKKKIIFSTPNKNIIVWEFEKGLKLDYQVHSQFIKCLIMCDDNRVVISASYDQTICIYDIEKNCEISKFQAHSRIEALALTKDQKVIISVGREKIIKLWKFPNGEKKDEFSTGDDNIYAIAIFADDNHFLTGGLKKRLNLWNIQTKTNKMMAILSEVIMGLMLSPDNHILIVYLHSNEMLIIDTHDYSFIQKLEIKYDNFHTYPIFLSQNNNRLMLYFDQLIDCFNGEIIFNLPINPDMKSFFCNQSAGDYYYITKDFELFKLEDYWLQTYIFNYLQYQSITTLNKFSEDIIKSPFNAYPFMLNFLHLIAIFEKHEYFTISFLEEIYDKKVNFSYFFYLDIFNNTPLDIILLKKNKTLLNQYFLLFSQYIENQNTSFFQKARFFNYFFKENYNMMDLMLNIIDLCDPDLTIISKLLDWCFLTLDSSLYDNSLVFKELDDPIFITSDSVYLIEKSFIKTKLQEKTMEKTSIKEGVEENQSNIMAKVICLPGICNITNEKTDRFFNAIANCDPENRIFENKTLHSLAIHIWETQIQYYYLADFILFFIFFTLFNINVIYLFPLRNNIYYNDPDVENSLNIVTILIDCLLLVYGIFSCINEIRQFKTAGSFSGYFKSIWNYFDVLLIPSLILTGILDIVRSLAELEENALLSIKVISAACIFCFWFRFLSFFRVMTETSSMIRLIFNVITKSKYFLLFMIIFMLTLSSTLYLLHTDNLDENPAFWDTFLVFYSTTVGDTSGISSYDLILSQLNDLFMIFSTFLFTIILLNLLVSIISEIYDEIKTAGSKTRLYELLNIVVETNCQLTTQIIRFFRKETTENTYLIQLYNEKHEEKEVNLYESLEKRMEQKIVRGINKELQMMNGKTEKENNEKFEKMNQKIDEKFLRNEDKMEQLHKKVEKLFEGMEKIREYLEKGGKNSLS